MTLRQLIIITAVSALTHTAIADTILLNEDFNGDYNLSFPYVYDGDALTPHSSIASLFYSNAAGATQPWWIVCDRAGATDKFVASHSYYQTPGTSSDWLISRGIDIPTEGFVLEFDAQSVNVRGSGHLSDLSVYVIEAMIDPANLPQLPTEVFRQIPWGNDPDNCEGDWTHYAMSLDAYAGKTVYISFVNENTDHDILCIDNVRVYRHDIAAITMGEYRQYTTETTANVEVTVAIGDEGVNHWWTLELLCAGAVVEKRQGTTLEPNSTLTESASISLETGSVTSFSWVFTADDMPSLTAGGEVVCLGFEPVHRVFFEETTSLLCGNCPIGAYNIESLLADPDLSDRVLPVSVHIEALGYDPMSTSSYYSQLPMYNAAPLVFVERSQDYDGFIPNIDCEYDTANPNSFAYRIASRADTGTTIDVEVSAEWVIIGNDTTAIDCRATVRPACDIVGSDYRVAFVLTENNVGLDRNKYWIQTNYLSGEEFASRAGGWCDLGEHVINARYHDVARAISAYDGHPGSLPADMAYGTDYEYTYRLDIPDTYRDDNGYVMSPAINPLQCEVTAIVIDNATGLTLNGARVPMDERATVRFTASDLAALGISDITVEPADDSEASAVYYDITGRRVASPSSSSGLYLRRTPRGVTKHIR